MHTFAMHAIISQQERGSAQAHARTAASQSSEEAKAPPAIDPSACSTCGAPLNEKQSGCDGEGRVVGGLGALPGFGWWPIKAYRPCPQLNKRGIDYVRKGQGLDDTLFGGGSLGQEGNESFEKMREQRERGLDVDMRK